MPERILWDQKTTCAVVSVAFSFILVRSSRGSLCAPLLYWNLWWKCNEENSFTNEAHFFLLIFGVQQGLVRSNPSGQWAYSGKLVLPPISICPRDSPSYWRKWWDSSQAIGVELLMKLILSLFIFMLSCGKDPSKSSAGDKAWNRNAYKRKCLKQRLQSQRKQAWAHYKRTFSLDDCRPLWSVEDCTRQAGGSEKEKETCLCIKAPAVSLKNK